MCRHVFLSGKLSVLSGGTVILLTLVTMSIIYIISRCLNIQIFHVWMRPSNNVFIAIFGTAYTTCHQTPLCVRFLKTRKLQVYPPLNFLTIPNWLNVRFHCFLIRPKFKILNTLISLASIYVTLVHCYH